MNLGILVGIILMIILFLFSYCACVISSRYSRLEEEEDMSILQEYEKIIGKGKNKAINDYIKYCTENNRSVLYSDVVYKPEEYKLFEQWFNKFIEPFDLFQYDEKSDISINLDYENYWYDWLEEKKLEHGRYGDGHCYNDIFEEYLEKNFTDLNKGLKYDSESGMFCVYCESMELAEEVIYELAKLYKDEDKMVELIKAYKDLNNIHIEI